MALDPVDAWTKRLLQNQPVNTKFAGAKNLADFYGDMADKVQGVGGSVGIFKFNRGVFVQTLAPGFNPDPVDPSWAARVSAAWQTAVAASDISPGTVTNPAWTASAVDILTAPKGAATIITLAQAKNLLQVGLIAAGRTFKTNNEQGQKLFAKAFREATLAFTFLTIGLVLVPPAPPIPLPIPTPAE